jgi:hypothetical protein
MIAPNPNLLQHYGAEVCEMQSMECRQVQRPKGISAVKCCCHVKVPDGLQRPRMLDDSNRMQ